MNFAFSDEQEQLRDAVRRFLETKSPSTEVRRLMETTEGYDPAVWSQMANELGLQSLHIPEEFGGQGFTFIELGIVLEEMGRVLLCAPYFATVVLAADAIMNAGTPDQQGKLLPGIASGETIAALAFTEPNGKWDANGIEMVAKGSGDSYTLDGTKMFVIDGHTANLIVVAARTEGTSGEDGISFFTVDADAPGLTRTPLATMDQTRKQAKLEFSGVAATPLGEPGAGWPALSKTLDQAAALSSNEMVGGAQKVLEMSVEYAKVRVQFGRPIGSFQAIKHKCADMLLEVVRAPPADPDRGDAVLDEGHAEVVVEAVSGAEQPAHGTAAAHDDAVLLAGAVPQHREQAREGEDLDVVEVRRHGHLLCGEGPERLERGRGHRRSVPNWWWLCTVVMHNHHQFRSRCAGRGARGGTSGRRRGALTTWPA